MAAMPSLPPYGNGFTIFPGGIPLYKNGILVGAIGVSGDGVDQDDYIAVAICNCNISHNATAHALLDGLNGQTFSVCRIQAIVAIYGGRERVLRFALQRKDKCRSNQRDDIGDKEKSFHRLVKITWPRIGLDRGCMFR